MRRSIPWILVVLLVFAIAGLLLRLQQVTHQFDEVAVQAKNANASLRQTQQRLTDLSAELAKQPVPSTTGQAKKKSDGPRVVHMRDVIRDHPELAAIWQKDARRRVMEQYGDVIAALHLPPDQAERLKQLLAEKEQSPRDAREAALSAGIKAGSQAMRDAVASATKQVDDEIVALVGPENSAQLADASGVASYASSVKSYAYDLADAGIPMTPEQSQNLARVVYTIAEKSPHPAESNQVDPTTGLSPADQQALDQAAKFLSPAQLNLLKASRIQDNQKQAVMSQYFKKTGGTNITIMD